MPDWLEEPVWVNDRVNGYLKNLPDFIFRLLVQRKLAVGALLALFEGTAYRPPIDDVFRQFVLIDEIVISNCKY
ncbi:hypothetical protein AS890_13610 [Rhizobium anhuiense bv. trifolii]|jgi:hypothetical protein|nr:hypothetical protein AS890_13610 [Rhizobium anhuiense bv. trifolii]